MSVYDKIGGEAALTQAVAGFYERMLADPRVSGWFDGIDVTQLMVHVRAFLAVALGGPEHYTGRSMRLAHSGLQITDEAYTICIGHLTDTLRDLRVDDASVEQIMKPLEMMRAAIVQRT